MAVCLFCTDSPMSSAQALRVEVLGREVESWSKSMSRQSTNRVGDMGQPCRTPERRVMEGKSEGPILS